MPSHLVCRSEASSPEVVNQRDARSAIIQQKMPSTPGIDRVGIYRKFTGTVYGNLENPTMSPNECKVGECVGECSCAVDLRSPSVDWIS